MIAITIHFISLLIGFIVGVCVMGVAFLCFFYDDRWDDGFSKGWDSGKKYGGKYMEEQKNKNEHDK